MAYATQTQIQYAAGGSARLLQLTDQEGTGSVNTDVLAEAQAKAEAWIHSFLRLRIACPIDVSTLTAAGAATLARLSADETVYQLIQMTRVIGESDVAARKVREQELERHRDGKERLDEPMPAKSSAVQANIIERVGPISRRGMRGLW